MTRVTVIILIVLVFVAGCSSANKEYTDAISAHLKKEANGLELNYRSLSFQWVDTFRVEDKLDLLQNEFDKRLSTILAIETAAPGGLGWGKLFSLSFVTHGKLSELRNWEKQNRGIPFQSYNERRQRILYKDYYEFAYSNRDLSPWISELTNQIDQTDSLLQKYDIIKEGDLDLIANVLWYYNRVDNFYSNRSPSEIWGLVKQEVEAMNALNDRIQVLRKEDPLRVLHYEAQNKYKINNPFFGGVEQEIERNFKFDPEKRILE